MSAPVGSTASPPSVSTAAPRSPGATSPVAVVWCRQVDNEAESPGYTTVPEDFPGHRETLDVIRIVGNLTVNVADTHDYWDPDPTQPLSYYPNLFLYPAYGGRYTCLGRMFLSTEDRPRLGMKTLVLDTQQLLATGEFGPTILRWHASMGGPRREGSRPPPVPDPALLPVVGEGFLFHRGSTDPVLLVASEEWEGAMQAILELVRVLPASLTALGAILAFPYFLPQPKTNISEFTEQVPLSLALMRVGRGEAAGDRHAKRLGAWSASSLTVRDITDGVPPTPSKSKDSVPLVLQYIRDKNTAKLAPICQRVDFVEMARLKSHLADPEKQGGKDRRKEMWRIGTAMESAALLLQRARGRHVPVNVETAKRAQEYIQARVPADDGTLAVEPAVVATASAAPAHPPSPGQVPPWLLRPVEPMATPAHTDRVEVVPISVSDDPSLYRPEAPPPGASTSGTGTAPAGAVPASTPPPIAAPATPPVDLGALKQEVQKDLLRFIEERLAALTEGAAQRSTAAMESQLAEAVESRHAPFVAEVAQRNAVAIQGAVGDLESRLTARIDMAVERAQAAQSEASESLRQAIERRVLDSTETFGRAVAASTQELQNQIAEAEARQGQRTTAQVEQSTARLRDALTPALLGEMDQRVAAQIEARLGDVTERARKAVAETVAPSVSAEVDRKMKGLVEPKLVEVGERTQVALQQGAEALRRRIQADVDQAITDLKQRTGQAETELRAGLVAQLDLHLAEASDREATAREEIEAKLREVLDRRFTEVDERRAKEMKDLEGRLLLLLDGRSREVADKTQSSANDLHSRVAANVDEKLRASERRLSGEFESRVTQLQDGQLHGMAELQVRLQSYFEQKLKESQDREREKYLELLARLRGEVEAQLPKLIDSPKFDGALRERLGRTLEALRADAQKLVDERVESVESRLKTDFNEGVHRVQSVEQQIAERGKELVRLEDSIRADLDELDRRTAVLSDRLVPVVRKTWQRIAELEKAQGGGGETDLKLNQIRREFSREMRRVETEVAERTGEIRDRMEAAIANQGKVWLTLIRQLSQLTEDRRALEESRAALVSTINPMAPESSDDDGMDDLRDLSPPTKSRSASIPRGGEAPEPMGADPLEDVDRGARRRLRRSGSR